MKYNLLFLITIFLLSCSFKFKTCSPKFKKGDCIVFQNDKEFFVEKYYNLVIKVGKKYYQFAGYDNAQKITITDKFYNKTDDKHCEGMK